MLVTFTDEKRFCLVSDGLIAGGLLERGTLRNICSDLPNLEADQIMV